MSLQDKLDAFRARMAERVPAETRAIMARATTDLERSGQRERALKSGAALPLFELPNQDGTMRRSSDLLARGPIVVSVYRGVWCPLCNLELTALNEALPAIRAEGAELVAIAPHTVAHAAENRRKLALEFDLLSDAGNAWARQAGLVFALPEDLRQVYTGFGIELPRYNEDPSWTLPMPARFVVDQAGIVRHADVNPDYGVRPDPEETVRILRGLRKAA